MDFFYECGSTFAKKRGGSMPFIGLAKMSFLFLTSILVFGCDSKNSNDPSNSPNPTTESQALSRTYNLRGFGGCETGEIEVEAETQQGLLKLYCSSLQNSDKNNFCAESERIDLFAKECPGQEWDSVGTLKGLGEYFDNVSFEKRISESTAFDLEYQKLSNLVIEDVALSTGLNNEERQLRVEIVNKLTSCPMLDKDNISDCLHNWFQTGLSAIYHWPESESVVYYFQNYTVTTGLTVAPKADYDLGYILVMPEDGSQKVKLYATLWNIGAGARTLIEHFNHSPSRTILAEITLTR